MCSVRRADGLRRSVERGVGFNHRASFRLMSVTAASNEVQDGSVTAGFWSLTLGSIGVVFGDIGTSPLYAFREAVAGAAEGQPVTPAIVLGVLSLILWALFIVVTAKYVLLLLRADNNGEGG